MVKIDKHLFGADQEMSDELCPLCQSKLQFKHGKSGTFLACSAYPKCEFTKPLGSQVSVETIKEMPGSSCPECSAMLAVKKGRFGMFIGCSAYPECHYTSNNNSPDGNQSDQTAELAKITCPQCNSGSLVSRNSKSGKTFYACDAYPSCDYRVFGQPVLESCPECSWPIMMKKSIKIDSDLVCTKKSCPGTRKAR